MASYNAGGPPNGNYTQTANDDCTGVCAHTGGFWDMVGYNLTLNANATLSNAGGDMKATGNYWRLIMEEGSRFYIASTDMTYQFYCAAYGEVDINGVLGNLCRFGGQDNTNRMVRILTYGCWSVDYCTFEYMRGTTYSLFGYTSGYFNHVVFSNITNTSGYSFVWTSGVFSFYNATFTCSQAFQFWGGYELLIDTDNVSFTAAIPISAYYLGSIILIGDNHSDYNAIWGYSGYTRRTMVYMTRITISSTPVGCSFAAIHPLPPDIPQDMHNYQWGIDANFSKFISGGYDGGYMYIIWKIENMDGDNIRTTAYYSKQGEAGSNNSQYHLVCCKEGYRTQETDVWCAVNQTYSPELQEQANFDDLSKSQSCCSGIVTADVKSFKKEMDSLSQDMKNLKQELKSTKKIFKKR